MNYNSNKNSKDTSSLSRIERNLLRFKNDENNIQNSQSTFREGPSQRRIDRMNNYREDCDLEKYLEFGFPFNKCDTQGQY
jgi:hypothetical protein